MTASNRQKKILRLFGIPFHASISGGAAGWEIGRIFSNPKNRDRWKAYVYLTRDFDAETSDLRPFDKSEIEICILPDDFSTSSIERTIREEIAAQILANESPFDAPQPPIVFGGRTFVFTGKFDFGKRRLCEQAVLERGGLIPPNDSASTISAFVDYLVVGTQGNPSWSSGAYGRKIESAVVCRRDHGTPAIISEDHWRIHL